MGRGRGVWRLVNIETGVCSAAVESSEQQPVNRQNAGAARGVKERVQLSVEMQYVCCLLSVAVN